MNSNAYLNLNNQKRSGLSSAIKNCIKLSLIEEKSYKDWYKDCPLKLKNWIDGNNFKSTSGSVLLFPDSKLNISEVFAIVGNKNIFWEIAKIKKSLPKGNYKVFPPKNNNISIYAVAWALENYNFSPFISKEQKSILFINQAQLCIEEKNLKEVLPLINGVFLARDLINLPANLMNPEKIEEISIEIAKFHNAEVKIIKGEKLKNNFPAIYTVGRAAEESPRLIDLHLIKDKKFPNITLVGKGVTFDSGGLDLKPAKAMEIMKKDMGGAAIAMGLVHSLILENLDANIRLIIPTVENAVSRKSMRPLDVIRTRSGIDVEIGNTDAEGRLILADALNYANEQNPDLLIDFATLTGAARVALGTELPALFSNNSHESLRLISVANKVNDPIFQMPLHKPYERFLNKANGALSSTGSSAYGGAITAALFLQKFIKKETNWMHLDVMAWNIESLPGRPLGGEATSLRALFYYLKDYIKNYQ